MKKVPLNSRHGEVKFALVDDEDYDFISKLSWHICDKGYAKSSSIVIDEIRYKKTIRMHRLIINASKGLEIDHINGDKLDNRKQNLRVCSHKENCYNRPSKVGTSSKFKGVSMMKLTSSYKWRAVIRMNGEDYHLGLFESEEDAAIAYNEKAKEFFGEFARLNVI